MPAAVKDAPAAITAPAAIRATRIRVLFVIWLLPPVAEFIGGAALGAVINRGDREHLRFTCAPEIRMPRFTFPIFQEHVKVVARAMSPCSSLAAHQTL
ncbi:hypothetical protein GCM10023084_20430 [Streptomyces lacrimifluminis]|uniref:Uncharacterized protein n=1 Tax=Streptomyces lacrimifluminis TaxID=1500077 RepID=A0A917KZB6_9ACTN|nr:hypothetical protein GCM10012282_34640 [Streptomyces lacrimifluminis]